MCRAGRPLTRRSMVRCSGPPVHGLKCPRARHLTPSCPWRLCRGVWSVCDGEKKKKHYECVCTVKCFGWFEKKYSPFYHICYDCHSYMYTFNCLDLSRCCSTKTISHVSGVLTCWQQTESLHLHMITVITLITAITLLPLHRKDRGDLTGHWVHVFKLSFKSPDIYTTRPSICC